MQRRGLDPPLRRFFFPVEGIFPLELTWVLTPFPQTLSDENINRSPVCAHMHSIGWTQKILTFMPYTGGCGNKNTPNMHHPRRRNVTKNQNKNNNNNKNQQQQTVTYAKIPPKMVNPRDIAGERRRRSFYWLILLSPMLLWTNVFFLIDIFIERFYWPTFPQLLNNVIMD